MDLELKKIFTALGRILIENGYLFKLILLLTFMILAIIVSYIYRD